MAVDSKVIPSDIHEVKNEGMTPSAEIRRQFLDYFRAQEHTFVPSASLIPEDRTVLLTIAGMLPFKPYFLGKKTPSYKRATSVQKCIRTNDIDNVGRTPRHHTFFEMLGNFSFGDYFKEEAIRFGWEFLTKTLAVPTDKLFITVFKDDDEAFDLWTKIVDKSRITRLDEHSNFWASGPTGPCGPCSEIYYDYGPDPACKNPNCAPNCDCNRFVEIWNLVFMESNRDEQGKLSPLPKKNIDTGMGLERISAALQGVRSNFETDLFTSILSQLDQLTGQSTLSSNKAEYNFSRHVIADHIRAIVFMIADGIYPGNDGRGYILKKILRRAVRHGKRLGVKLPFLDGLAHVVIDQYGAFYTELKENKAMILDIIKTEESNFVKTLGFGLNLLEDILKRAKVVTGEDAFKLFDTYGFPLELTEEIALEKNVHVDVDGFIALMEQQKERARTAATFYQTEPGQDKPKGGEAIIAKTEQERIDMARNHSGTHLLQSALQQILGKHVAQAGSLVSHERLRFDFSHPKALTPEQLQAVESKVNELIMKNVPVIIEEISYDEAIAEGAMALFTEKYENKVRVVKMTDGQSVDSIELCGGTHVARTGDIGLFLISSETAISSGVRRIEAVTGSLALAKAQELKSLTNLIANTYKISVLDIPARMDQLTAQIQSLQKQLASLQLGQISAQLRTVPLEKIGGTSVLIAKLNITDSINVKDLLDTIFPSVGTVVALFLVQPSEQKITVAIKASQPLQDKGIGAGVLVKACCELLDGNGGGKPDFAQGGGKALSKVDDAIAYTKKFLLEKLS